MKFILLSIALHEFFLSLVVNCGNQRPKSFGYGLLCQPNLELFGPKDGSALKCEIQPEEHQHQHREVILTEDVLGPAIIGNYTIREYPTPITSFRLTISRDLTITSGALNTLMPNLRHLHVVGPNYPGNPYQKYFYVTIEPDATRELTALEVTGNAVCRNGTMEAVLSTDSLQFLTLGRGNLQILTRGAFRRLKYLVALYLHFEENVTAIKPGAFDGLTNLTALLLSWSGISRLPPGFAKDLGKVTYLILKSNQLDKLTNSTFLGLNSLTSLDLYGNPISTIEPGAFDGIPNISELKMAVNAISRINSTTFRGLENLQRLQLWGCERLESIERGAFDHLTNLRYLDMSGNRLLRHLPDGLFDKLNKLEEANFKVTCIENLSRANFTHCHPRFRIHIDNC